MPGGGVGEAARGSLDGTKVAANASLAANLEYQTLEAEVRQILTETKTADEAQDGQYGPDRRGDELPEGLGRRTHRLQRLQEVKARLEERAAQVAQAAKEKLVQRQAEEAATGNQRRGRNPRVVAPTSEEETKANVTDPDSRIFMMRLGHVQGYNVQTVVSEDQIIVAVAVTQEATTCSS